MSYRGLVKWLAVSVCLLLTTGVSSQRVQGQAQQPAAIESLAEPGERLLVRDTSRETGLVTFASSSGNGLLLPIDAAAPAEARALAFAAQYGRPFGLVDAGQLRLMSASPADALGVEHVRLQQYHQGVLVRGGEFVVHLRGARAVAANGRIVANLPADVTPALAGNVAVTQASELVAKRKAQQAGDTVYSEPRLEIFDRAALSHPASLGSRLAWFVEATGPAQRDFIWVDAQNGAILLNFSQLTEAKSRRVHDAGFSSTLPGTLRRVEGDPATGDPDEDNAYNFAGQTYDYFFNNHGRDSFDGVGGQIISTVDYCPASGPCPNYPNAFWNGTQMVYGNGFASADDVVGHELTHAVTERSAGLLYYYQSGALNESFSDIFGEVLDLTNGSGTDTAGVRWLMGEDLSIGAIRNMMNPPAFDNPSRMGDAANFFCTDNAWTDPNGDSGGVHINSGIPNHAFALMVDGGSFNGRTVTGIGIDKAAKIQYRALTVYLTSGSTFLDDYNAVNQSCSDLIGTSGITAGDCTQVTTALQAVEMNATWACSGATATPAMCTSGAPTNVVRETFETNLGNWTATNTTDGVWQRDRDFARGGVFMAYGNDAAVVSDHRLSMTSPVTVPAGGRMYFDHAFEFENDFFASYDGGVLEYSTDGTTWNDAAPLIDAGQTYSGTIDTSASNPLGGRSGFVNASFGYTGTRLNLASLAGQNVRFRFRIGTDETVGSLGWVVDNVAFYTCGTVSAPGAPTGVSAVAGNALAVVSFTPPANNGGSAITSYRVTSSPGGITATGTASPITVTGLTNGTTYTFTVAAINAVGTGASSAPSNAVTPSGPLPGTPINFVVSASGVSITGSWTSVGAPATGHVLEVATSAAFSPVIFTQSLGPATSFALDAPPGTTGTFFFRVTAVNALGSSAPTAGVPVSLPGVPPAPGPPLLNAAAVSGNDVSLSWSAGPGGAPASYLLIVGSSSGASNIGAFPMGPATSISASAPDGTYFARVQASNVSGSAVSNEISFTIGAPCIPPGPPASITATRVGSLVTVSWTPPATGTGPVGYTLLAGTASGLSNVGEFPMGGALSISTGAPPGTYFLRVRAANACGVSTDSIETSITVP